MRSALVGMSSINLVTEALQAASCAVEFTGGDSARQWELVSSDSVAGSFFLRSLSISLGLELPSSLLQCKKIEEVAAKITELSEGVCSDRSNRVPLHAIRPHQRSPRVAIISASCRLPGGVETLGDLWSDILVPGRDAITPIPASRWNADLLYDPEGGEGTIYVKEGGFIEDAEAFDNRFFEIPDHEASQMDPQQRLLLEAAFEARAPLMKGRIRPTDETGVFIGCSCADWFLVHAKLTARDSPSCFIVDLQHAMLANRISYCMNLEGASMTIDTATSSGIVAFCTAVSHIESGRMICALAGSSQLIIAPEVTVALCNLGMLSRKGRCRPFDEASDGFIRSEGVVVLSLVREDYVSDYVDTSLVSPLAYVRGHAVVHSGRAFSTTAPSEGAERRVMEGALSKANISPNDVDYIEAHGTGTRMGDAVEVQSLAAVFGNSHEPARPLLVGSIKGNIGHCEGASGGAGICKAILVLINRCVPGTLHFNRLSSLIDRVPQYFSIPRTATKFPVPDRPLVVGVSSFGVGGCNGHVILEGPAAGQHDFKAQLNDKCYWKKNRFPWSHLISMPGGSNGGVSPVELITPEGCIATPTSSFCGTTFSLIGPSTDQDAGRSGSVVFTEVPVLGPGNVATHRRPKETHQDNRLNSICCGNGSHQATHAEVGTFSSGSEELDMRPDGSSHSPGRSSPFPLAVNSPHHNVPASSAPTISREQIKAAVDEALKLALNLEEPLQENTPFVEAGVDSMTSIGIREGLSKRLKIQLPATILYDHPCVEQLVEYLEQISSAQEGDVGNQMLPGVGHPTARCSVAVTALACRFPPKARRESEFWDALQAGQDCIHHIPLTRFDPWKYRDSDVEASNKLYVNDAGIYPDMALFDNASFNISIAEAQLMDPHQRVLLEVCHEAIASDLQENSILDAAIVVGCCNNDWAREACTSNQAAKSLTGTGGAASIVSNRLSYVFNLHGPSMTIDTACSSSLVALDVAKQLLNEGRCNAALAAGVHILINHHIFEQYCKAGMLSVDGRCKTFDASANGYVRSEGCGALLLKALPRQSTDPSSVYAWIRGAANNHPSPYRWRTQIAYGPC
ncbi:Soraphen polyketide synthase A, related, related [Eimeria praecox]|uniref:Soraphen polyketide synthase A, related, related n=1 Tax=Eimeria praecox TaxID=51316 RepID=U6G8K7_9EIME|nr:Soraphen polyketide synthase A, related, related [Eimeria praecox]